MKATTPTFRLGLALVIGFSLLPLIAQAGFTWDIGHNGAVNDFFELEAFHTFVTNTGAATDTVTVNMVKNIPGDWVASLCEDLLCYPPFILDIELILEPGQTKELIIDMTPVSTAGTGTTDIALASKQDPAVTAAAVFTVVTSGADVLYVSTTGDSQTDAAFTAALAGAGLTSATWNQATMGKADQTDLDRFANVVWATGTTTGTLGGNDRTNLGAYIAGGGNLFLTGSNLAYSYCDAGSPQFDTAAHSWFRDTLGVDYVANTGSTDFVIGSGSDPVFPNKAYVIFGGDGTNDNSSPDVVAPVNSGVASLGYSGGGTAVVASDPAGGKVLYAGFNFAGISSGSSRDAFMGLVFDWFTGATSAVGDDLLPVLASHPRVWPNPFNPQTSIQFEVGGDRPVPVALTIYDVQGRAVRHLFAGTVQPGSQRLNWNGRDDGDRTLAAGMYLARVQVAGTAQIVKMTLAK